jgi:hypothetical protein
MTEPPNEYLVIEWSCRVVSSGRIESYRVVGSSRIEWSDRVVSSDHSFYHPVLDFSKHSNELF